MFPLRLVSWLKSQVNQRANRYDPLPAMALNGLDRASVYSGGEVSMDNLQWIGICLAFLSANTVKGMPGRTQLAKKTRALVEHDRALNNWPRPNT
jgi:hypothetical protein